MGSPSSDKSENQNLILQNHFSSGHLLIKTSAEICHSYHNSIKIGLQEMMAELIEQPPAKSFLLTADKFIFSKLHIL